MDIYEKEIFQSELNTIPINVSKCTLKSPSDMGSCSWHKNCIACSAGINLVAGETFISLFAVTYSVIKKLS